jgi:hypothetical protein
MLQFSRLADDRGNWVGGESTLVITGDMMDRGRNVRSVLDLIMSLKKQASRKKGKVVAIMGNHEMMNLMSDLRYVTPEIFASFADKQSEKRRQDAYKKYLRIQRRQERAEKLPETEDSPELKAQWMAKRPPGFVEYLEAISRTGKYGKWLRKLPVVVKIDNLVFLHAGIHPELTALEISEINSQIKLEIENLDVALDFLVRESLIARFFNFEEIQLAVEKRIIELTGQGPRELRSAAEELLVSSSGRVLSETERAEVSLLRAFLGMGSWLSVHPSGPLWFRGYARWSKEEGDKLMSDLLKRYEADHFVVGHTIASEDRIVHRFDSSVYLVDTLGPAALEIRGGQFMAIYPEGREEPKGLEEVEAAGMDMAEPLVHQ